MSNMSKIPWIAEHINLYRTDPVKAHDWDSSGVGGPGIVSTLLLTTTGRQSGEPRSLPLIYGKFENDYAIVASKGGAPAHPAWFLNLQAQPECEIQVASLNTRAKARVATSEERERMWKRMAEIYPPYDDYQKTAADREIPIVILEPIS